MSSPAENNEAEMPEASRAPADAPWPIAIAEVLALLALCFLFAGSPVPEVNEAHYLAKARHYWDPAWCPHDAFLNSADAHQVFYWTLGWLTLLFPLPACAWIGRVVTWLLIAWAWQRLSWALFPRLGFSLISAAACLLLQRYGHMAGEWMVGGFEAKGPAFALVLFALEAMLRDGWPRACILLGAATAFHPLVGGWGLIASVFVWLAAGEERPSIWSLTPWLAASLALALLGVVPALLLTRGVPAAEVHESNYIYVFQRLPHHLDFESFRLEFRLRFAALVAIFTGIALFAPGDSLDRRLRAFIFGCLAIAAIGLILHYATRYHENPAWLLRYYWYRLADAMVPLGATLVVLRLAWHWAEERPVVSQFILAAASFAAVVGLGMDAWQRDYQTAPADSAAGVSDAVAWQDACLWAAKNTPTDACFLAPRNEHTFKWYAGRAEVVCWKDIPQDARGILDWWRRWRNCHSLARDGFRLNLNDLETDDVLHLAHEKGYAFDYVIVDLKFGEPYFELPCVYRNGEKGSPAYAIYLVPPAPEKDSPSEREPVK